MRESFLIYKSFYEPIKNLSNEKLGELFRGIFEYQIEKKECECLEIKMAFEFFKNQFRLDEEKYQKVCESRKHSGSMGGKQKVANASKCKQKVAKLADNENEKDNDKENKKDKLINEFIKEYPETSEMVITLLEDFIVYRKQIKKPLKTINGLKGYSDKLRDIAENGGDIYVAIKKMKDMEYQTVY